MKSRTNQIQTSQSVAIQNQAPDQGKQDLQLNDMRPEIIAQRKMQDIAGNSPQVSRLKALQRMVDESSASGQTENDGQQTNDRQSDSAQPKAALQLKPNDINNTTTITVTNGEVQTEAGERDDTSVAYPVNTISTMGWAKPGVNLKGGHLYKREFGGKDDYSNVVPWHEDIEADYTDNFEDVYSAGWKAKGNGPGDSSKDGDWKLNVKASFTETSKGDVEQYMPAKPASDVEDETERERFIDITRWSVDTIPDSASASIVKEGEPGTKKEWVAPQSPKAKSGVAPNSDLDEMREKYDYAHKKSNFEGPLDGDKRIKYAEDKLKTGASN